MLNTLVSFSDMCTKRIVEETDRQPGDRKGHAHGPIHKVTNNHSPSPERSYIARSIEFFENDKTFEARDGNRDLSKAVTNDEPTEENEWKVYKHGSCRDIARMRKAATLRDERLRFCSQLTQGSPNGPAKQMS